MCKSSIIIITIIVKKLKGTGLNTTKGNRLHIGFFGKRNAGKSSIVNKILGQQVSIVSDTPGTTTDINEKSMELLPIGPVTLMDTAGFDDVGELGELRVQKTFGALNRADVAVVVIDNTMLAENDFEFLKSIKDKKIPLLIILNKCDNGFCNCEEYIKKLEELGEVLKLSVLYDNDIVLKFKSALIKILPEEFIKEYSILAGIVKPLDTVILVIPIDKEAPKGRLILPQVNVLRELLDIGAIAVCTRDNELKDALESLKEPPKLVITDSQAFKKVSEIVPENIFLTSFSILFARYKGDLKAFVDGAEKIETLKNGDKILILESCTHHPVEDDIGKVKIPNLIRKFTGKDLNFEQYSGHDFPSDVSKYSLIIHCGACMTNRKEILNRIELAQKEGVSITNYGIAIAKCLGILDRAIEIFKL